MTKRISMYRALGVISGTSMDGIDVAVVDTDGAAVVRPGAGASYPYADDLRGDLSAAVADPDGVADLTALEARVTLAHVGAVRRFLRDHASVTTVDLVGLHGQTILHRPLARLTVQLGDGQHAARLLGIDTVDRFRQDDVAAGGQGAPLVPLYHQAMLAEQPGPLMVLNLGGVGNVTYLDGDTLLAFDTGPGSALLDDFVWQRCGLAFDRDGVLAASGSAVPALVAEALADPFFVRSPPKSLDRQHFHRLLAAVAPLSSADGAATLAAFTVASAAAAIAHVPRPPRLWLVTGGGRSNGHIMRELARALGVAVQPVESVGIDGDFVEAQAFGYLAVRSRHGWPLSLPTTTGVSRPMRGGRLHKAAG